jgi:hypothetical protein
VWSVVRFARCNVLLPFFAVRVPDWHNSLTECMVLSSLLVLARLLAPLMAGRCALLVCCECNQAACHPAWYGPVRQVGAGTRVALGTVRPVCAGLARLCDLGRATAGRIAEPSCKRSALRQLRQWRRNGRAASRRPSPSEWLPAMAQVSEAKCQGSEQDAQEHVRV